MDKVDEVLTRGVAEILPSRESLAKLMRERKISLYQGFDPSMSSLHLGNYVGLMKLRQFQKLGHEIIFLVGDFTGMIGDPDKLATRKMLTHKKVRENAKKWKEQASKVIDFSGENPAKMLFNSDWNFKLSFKDVIEITSKLTVQQLLERDMFQKRIQERRPIHLHEFLYPVAQAYDSVHMDVDLEIGGSDQIFNMLVGRTLMKGMKRKEKFVLATKLLVDKEGKKAGKTTDNAIFLDSSPEELYAGIMAFSDDLIFLGFELLTEIELDGLDTLIKENPLNEKKRLAHQVTKIVWGESDAKRAQEYFEKTFQKGKFPEKTEEVVIVKGIKLLDFVAKKVKSKSQAKRLLNQGAVYINEKRVKDPTYKLTTGAEIKIGKKIFIRTRLE